jgi:hypothetical protein
MQLIASRSYQFLDAQTLSERSEHATILGAVNEFRLHMAADDGIKERLVRFDCRATLFGSARRSMNAVSIGSDC